MSDFDVLGTVGKLALPIFARFRIRGKSELGLVRYGPASRVHRGVFGPFEGSFPIGIPAGPDKFLAIREFHVVHGCVLFPMCPGSQINLLRVRKTLCASVATSVGKFPELSAKPYFALHRGEFGFARYDPANGGRRNVPYAKGGGQFDPVFGLVNGPVKPWSNLVNLGQTWSNLVKALQTLGDSNLVNPSQTWSNLREMCPGPSSWEYLMWRSPRRSDRAGSVRAVLVLRTDTRENPGGTLIDDQSSPTRPIGCKSGGSTVWNLSPNTLRGDLTWGLPKLQIGWFNGLESQSKHVEGCKSGGSTVWNLSPNRLRGDLTWGLPKLQIGWFNGLESQSKHVEGCKSGGSTVWNLSPNTLRGDLTWGLPKLQIGWFNGLESQSKQVEGCKSGGSTVWNLSPNRLRGDLTWGLPKLQIGWFNGLESQSKQMSDRGSGSGGHRRSDRLAKGKAVAYAPESSPDTDDEYDAMEDVRTRLDASIARNLQAELRCRGCWFLAPSAARAPPRPGVVIGRSAGPSETTRPSPQPGVTTGPSDAPSAAPRRASYQVDGYPPHGGIRPRYPVAVEISDTPLLTNLLAHPSSLVRRCQEPPYSAGRGGWSEFSRLLAVSRPEYREFLIELGFGPFLSIPYVSVYHPAIGALSLGIRFGGRAPPSEPIDGFEAREILGLADRDAIEGTRRPSVRIRHLADVLRRDREEPPTELRYRQEYDWGALTYGFYIRGLRRYSRRESISFLGFWQFTVFWAFEHFPTFAPSRLPLASDPDFPLARRWDTSRIERMTTCTLLELRMTVDCIRDADIIFQPYSAALSQRPEVFRAVALSRLRLWIRTTRSWELLLGERTVRQLGDEAVVPVDPSPLMTIEDYIPRAPSDPYIAGVEGGRVMGGVAMDSHHIRSSGQIERLESEILRLQLELSVSVDRHTADMDRVQERDGQYADGGDTARGGDGADAEGFGPEPEGLRFSRCGAGCSGGDHTEIRGPASWHGHYSCYRSWPVWSWSAFFFATS
uniref:Aminotransferase-like plant mobile domain-containing protein n=1 Tax=Fagus sylvatica TaxID=28930 RepID=A0A2N9G5P8_FAGSY